MHPEIAYPSEICTLLKLHNSIGISIEIALSTGDQHKDPHLALSQMCHSPLARTPQASNPAHRPPSPVQVLQGTATGCLTRRGTHEINGASVST
jgi:hypothetical protein